MHQSLSPLLSKVLSVSTSDSYSIFHNCLLGTISSKSTCDMDEWKDRQIIYFNFLHLVIICLHVSLCIKVHVERSEDKFGGVSPFFHPADSRDQTEDCGYLCLLRCLSSSLCLSNVDPPPSFLLPPGSLHRSLPVSTPSLCSFCLHCFIPITLIQLLFPFI